MLPCRPHAQERHVRNRLCVCCDPIMLLVRQMRNLRLEATQNPLHQRQLLGRSAVVDDYQGLALRAHGRAVHRVTGNDEHILGQVLLKCRNLGRLDRSLAGHDRADLCCWKKGENGDRLMDGEKLAYEIDLSLANRRKEDGRLHVHGP